MGLRDQLKGFGQEILGKPNHRGDKDGQNAEHHEHQPWHHGQDDRSSGGHIDVSLFPILFATAHPIHCFVRVSSGPITLAPMFYRRFGGGGLSSRRVDMAALGYTTILLTIWLSGSAIVRSTRCLEKPTVCDNSSWCHFVVLRTLLLPGFEHELGLVPTTCFSILRLI